MYWPEFGTGVTEMGLGKTVVDETEGGTLDCNEVERYRCGICAFNNGNSVCKSVMSKVVEYLKVLVSHSKENGVTQHSKRSTHPK